MQLKLNELFGLRRKRLFSLQQIRERAGNGDLYRNCPSCGRRLARRQLREQLEICPSCGAYLPMSARARIAMLADENTFRELDADLCSTDPLAFPGYAEKLIQNEHKTGLQEAVVTGTVRVDGRKVALGVMDSRFLMGSMGTVVGEKIARLAEYAASRHLPLVIFSASGGARMQEGLFSLMQMAKTSAAVERYKRSGGVFISCLTDPTTGGVSASFASLGDIMLAEPRALICFAGPRVIEQTIGETLPEGFQRAEYLLEHGMLDLVVERPQLRETLSRLIGLHSAYEKEAKHG